MLLVVVNVPGDYSLWPVLKVIIYGRSWVTAKAMTFSRPLNGKRYMSQTRQLKVKHDACT